MVIEDDIGELIKLMLKFHKVARDTASLKIIEDVEINEFALWLTMQEIQRRRDNDAKKDSRHKKDDSR